MTTPTLLFDVNETLLDMSALDPLFEQTFGTAHVRQDWFLILQGLWMTATLTDSFKPFDTLAAAALTMTAERDGRPLQTHDRERILNAMKTLPAHADAHSALDLLRASGVRLAALSNGSLKGVTLQLQHAKLVDKFDAIFAADQVKQYKPASAPYLFAARKLKLKPSAVDLVAAHAWDIAGAAAAGLHTVFVRRPGKTLNPSGTKPDIVVSDLTEFAQNVAVRRRRAARWSLSSMVNRS
jgi:2-haloacid dehalogenase